MKDIRLKDIYVTAVLICINILLFAVMLIMNGEITTGLMIKLGAQYWPLVLSGEWWRLITCNFLHFTAQHLMCNMIVLFALGSLMEPVIGHVRFTVIYMLSGIGGSALSYLFNMLSRSNIVAAGASTSVYGLLGAMACIIFLGYGAKIGIYISKKQFVLFALLNIAGSLIGESNIDYMGHIGGIVTGTVIFAVMGTIEISKKERTEH